MDAQKADMFIMSNSKYFESYDLPFIREKLLELDEDKAGVMSMIQFKDPTTILIVSILAGSLGLDRFMIGDTGVGIGKLITCGGFGIWSIVDWFLIQAATREKNKQKMFMMLGGIQV
ncbi:MAG: TM2 domain-containing protein [Tannerellaceae bacterium]|nr:TM2 domain-containing protein [Tannerellaceae bacterium]